MSIVSAFQVFGQTVAVTTSGTTLTAAQQTILLTGSGTGFVWNSVIQPPCCRVVNTGTTPVFISFNGAARVAAVPTNVAYSLELPVMPGAVEVFSNLPWTSAGTSISGTSLPQMQLVIATIAVGTSQPLFLTFGEGV